MEIYEPREDSFLLEKYVKELAKGNCLDVGTGSGIQAKAALEKADKVVGVDINPRAIAYCRKEISKAEFFVSDLFSFFRERSIPIRFDTIIFNAPYLPEDEKDPDPALDGGKEGWEIIARFLEECDRFFSEKGMILLIFSSKTNKEKVDELISEKGYKKKLLEKIHVFFEDIYCYKITR